MNNRYCVDVCFDLDDNAPDDARSIIENALEDALNKLSFVTNVEALNYDLI